MITILVPFFNKFDSFDPHDMTQMLASRPLLSAVEKTGPPSFSRMRLRLTRRRMPMIIGFIALGLATELN